MEVDGHDPVETKGRVVAFDARDRFRVSRIVGQGVVVVATVNKAWARTNSSLAELLRSAGFRLPCSPVARDVVDFQLPEGAEEPVRKGAHTSYKRKGVKERQEALCVQLLKEVEEKRAARSSGNE